MDYERDPDADTGLAAPGNMSAAARSHNVIYQLDRESIRRVKSGLITTMYYCARSMVPYFAPKIRSGPLCSVTA